MRSSRPDGRGAFKPGHLREPHAEPQDRRGAREEHLPEARRGRISRRPPPCARDTQLPAVQTRVSLDQKAANQPGSAPAGGGQRLLRKRADGVVLIMTQGLGGVGDTAPLTGYTVSTPRYRLHRKVKSSPGLLTAPSGAMPPPSVTSCSNRSPLTVRVP